MHDGRAAIGRSQLAPHERRFVAGLWCTAPTRAVFDEVVRRGRLRPGVAAACMALAARTLTLEELRRYAATRPAWEGIPLFRDVVALSNECFRSGPEVYLQLRWRLDAGLPEPLANPPVFTRDGRLLGYPDLLDVEAGVVGEYDGSAHRSRDRHRADVAREDRFRGVGLEYFTVVAGDLADERLVVTRMRDARSRARFAPPPDRPWTLDPAALVETPTVAPCSILRRPMRLVSPVRGASGRRTIDLEDRAGCVRRGVGVLRGERRRPGGRRPRSGRRPRR